ncbi:unnamed protein product [Diatraea saccharalis]|uniref:Uncharacterized protein n=1 Tax=Diatraea saccharalis TaxID=40085 RepID=A0A9P0FYN4_9NEOP|nr:unnamed protein product [Diatraea saccharalis]
MQIFQMNKSVALLLFFSVACMSAPATDSELESILDDIFGPSTSTNEPAVVADKNQPPVDLDTIIREVFESNVTTSTTSTSRTEDETECDIGGQKGACTPYYLCPEAAEVSEGIIDIA